MTIRNWIAIVIVYPLVIHCQSIATVNPMEVHCQATVTVIVKPLSIHCHCQSIVIVKPLSLVIHCQSIVIVYPLSMVIHCHWLSIVYPLPLSSHCHCQWYGPRDTNWVPGGVQPSAVYKKYRQAPVWCYLIVDDTPNSLLSYRRLFLLWASRPSLSM